MNLTKARVDIEKNDKKQAQKRFSSYAYQLKISAMKKKGGK